MIRLGDFTKKKYDKFALFGDKFFSRMKFDRIIIISDEVVLCLITQGCWSLIQELENLIAQLGGNEISEQLAR